MLTIMGATLVLAGAIWLARQRWRSSLHRSGPGRPRWNLADMEAACQVLGAEIGWDLGDESQRELFLTSYREKVRSRQLPTSPEWEREIFNAQDDLGRSFEHARRASITLWYLMGQMERPKLQAVLLEYLYRLYAACSKSTRGLQAELGPRTGLPQIPGQEPA